MADSTNDFTGLIEVVGKLDIDRVDSKIENRSVAANVESRIIILFNNLLVLRAMKTTSTKLPLR